MRTLIVDDEHPARKLLAAYLGKLPEMALVGQCKNALEALSHLQQEEVDLMFLDIQMPNLSGLELLRTLKRPPMVVFTTAYAAHAVTGFELDAVDYLVKPFSFERFVQAVNKASELHRLRLQPVSNTASPTPEVLQDHFFVKADYKLVKLYYADILYIEGMREYIAIHTQKKRHIVYQTMKYMEALLPSASFARIHKSYIVALPNIRSVYGNTIELDDKELPIGKSYKADFMKRINTL